MNKIIKFLNFLGMSRVFTVVLAISAITIYSNSSVAQTWGWPWISVDTSGDTTWHTFPPDDSTFVPNEIAIKFQKGALDYTQLCYDCDTIASVAGLTSDSGMYFPKCKETLMTQQFDLSLVIDASVRSVLAMNGVAYLQRMTAANPCTDTLSITRFGDTVSMDDYDWIIVFFNNDTSVVPTLEELYTLDTSGDTNSIEFAELDQLSQPNYTSPNDPWFTSAPQVSLTDIGMTGTPGAWDYDVGDAGISVAVVDNGIDYWRCDLGAGIGSKVINGWDFEGYRDTCTHVHHGPSLAGIFHTSDHGTEMASIIGAYTNNFGCGIFSGSGDGMAGIGGGFGTLDRATSRGPGIKLVGYNCTTAVNGVDFDNISTASAILEAVALSVHGYYGDGVTVINNSYGVPNYDIGLRSGVWAAKNNFVDFVASAGNGAYTVQYPSDYDPQQEVICVGGANHLHHLHHYREYYSNSDKYVDMIAPAGNIVATGGNLLDDYVYTLKFDPLDCISGPSGNADVGLWESGTSVAAAHVSGVDALLRGYLLNAPQLIPHTHDIGRGDPENIIKAAANDVTGPDPDNPSITYATGYDVYTGWGFLQADSIFQMLDYYGRGYLIAHLEVPTENLTYGSWSATKQPVTVDFSNGPTNCLAYIREITGYDSYSSLNADLTKPVYVWGNDYLSLQRGWPKPDAAGMLWQDPWCEVTDGELGNELVEGLRHEYSTTVNLHTYQYDLYTAHGAHLGHYPPDRPAPPSPAIGVGIGFTVFYVPGIGGLKAADGPGEVQKTSAFSVWPIVASDVVNVMIDPSALASQFVLVDALGRIVRQPEIAPSTSNFEISTSDLPSGIYICRLTSGNGINAAKIIVCH